MARPRKIGLDYFPIKVNFAFQDGVKFSMDDHGDVPVAGIYLFLLAEIYGEQGYYMRWNERVLRSFAKRLYSDPTVVGAVVNSLVANGAFDTDLYARAGILTSVEIQANYVRAGDKREEVVIIREYSLLDDRDTTRANIVWENLPTSDCPRIASRMIPECFRNDTDIPPESPRFSSGFPPETGVSDPGIPPETSEKSFPETKTAVSDPGNPQTKPNNTNTNTITNNNNGHCPVDNYDVLTRMATIIGTDAAQRWMNDPNGSPDYCAAQLALMDRQRDTIRNQRQWLLSALQHNWARWQPPVPRPDPNCPDCGGTGFAVDFDNNKTRPCSCIPRTVPAVSLAPQLPASDHNPAALAAALAAKWQ